MNLEEKNNKLAEIFFENGINRFLFTSVGNSIGTGYSMMRKSYPLLFRNETIDSIMIKNAIRTDIYHFSRAQNNNDEHIFEWLTSNIKVSSINKLNRADSIGPNKMANNEFSLDELNHLYPISVNNDLGLLDIVSTNGDNIANVIVYNGGTGSFLDNITRGGVFRNQFMHGINRNVSYISSFLSYIQTLNRVKECDTQVYLCGAPNYLGLNLTSLLNNKLKKISDEFANVSYVSPVKSKFLYKSDDGHMGFDIHYDEDEYLKFNYNIISSITNNYTINKAMIKLDRYMYFLNAQIETGDICRAGAFTCLEDFSIVLVNQLKGNDLKYEFYESVRNYITERFPYDYYYFGKENVKKLYK